MLPTENPWPLMILCLAGAVFAVILATQTGRSRYLIGAVGCLAIGGAGFLVDHYVLTEKERITAEIHAVANAFQQHNTDAVLSHLSKQSKRLRLLAAGASKVVTIGDDMRITDVTVELKREGTLAISRFRLNATFSLLGAGSLREPTRWEVRWQQEEGAWKIFEVTELDPITGKPRDRLKRIPIPSMDRPFGEKSPASQGEPLAAVMRTAMGRVPGAALA